MKFLLSIFIFFSCYSTLYADEIFNLLKIPNLEVLELNSKNKIKYFNTKENFIIGTTQNIVCDKVGKNNLIKKYKVVKRNLDIYSYEFLKKNNLRFVVLCKNLSISGIQTAGIPDKQKRTLILDINFDPKYFERVIHHEVFHIINDSYKEIFDEKVWSEFNIKNFKYAECSTCTDKLGLDTYPNTDGFFTEYSQSTASEDMAEVFSHLMIGSELNINDPILNKKIQFIKKNLFKIDNNFSL